ncbi:MAG: hypothetical protein R2877_07055 [Bdellovibrionota bacterium]
MRVFPAATRLECAVNIPQAIFVGMQAANLGITPRIFEVLIYTNDWHIDTQLPSANQATCGSHRSLQKVGVTFLNLLPTRLPPSTPAHGSIPSPVKMKSWISHMTRSSRGLPLVKMMRVAWTIRQLLQCSLRDFFRQRNHRSFQPGSMGGPQNLFYPYIHYNPATNVHADGYSGLASAYSDEAGMWLMAKLLGVNLADFGITERVPFQILCSDLPINRIIFVCFGILPYNRFP